MEETSQDRDSSGTINTPEEDTVRAPDTMVFPNAETQEEEEIVEEIDTSTFQKDSIQKKDGDNLFVFCMLFIFRDSNEGSAEEFQNMLLNMLSGIMGTDVNGNPNPEFEAFARDFKEGFTTGASASQQYSQYVQTASNNEATHLGWILQFLFGASSGLSWMVTCTDV